MADVILNRPLMPQLTLTAAACQTILDDLVAREQAYVEQANVVYWRMPPALGLLIIYTGHFPNRRLVEQFQLSYNPNLFEGLQFRGDACTTDLPGALTCIGRLFAAPLNLNDVYMAVYHAASRWYVTPSQLCTDGGAWSSRPAVLRDLEVGFGLSLLQTPQPYSSA